VATRNRRGGQAQRAAQTTRRTNAPRDSDSPTVLPHEDTHNKVRDQAQESLTIRKMNARRPEATARFTHGHGSVWHTHEAPHKEPTAQASTRGVFQCSVSCRTSHRHHAYTRHRNRPKTGQSQRTRDTSAGRSRSHRRCSHRSPRILDPEGEFAASPVHCKRAHATLPTG